MSRCNPCDKSILRECVRSTWHKNSAKIRPLREIDWLQNGAPHFLCSRMYSRSASTFRSKRNLGNSQTLLIKILKHVIIIHTLSSSKKNWSVEWKCYEILLETPNLVIILICDRYLRPWLNLQALFGKEEQQLWEFFYGCPLFTQLILNDVHFAFFVEPRHVS